MSHKKKEALLIDMNQRLSWIEYLSCKASAQALKSPISIPDQPLATLEELHRGPGEVLRPLPPDHAGLAEGAGKVSYPGWSKAQCRISRGNEQKGLIGDFISKLFAGSCIAQKERSCFSPSSPGFISQRSPKFSVELFSTEL